VKHYLIRVYLTFGQTPNYYGSLALQVVSLN